MTVDGLVVNRLHPRFGPVPSGLGNANGALRPLVRNLADLRGIGEREESHFATLMAAVAPAPVARVPFLAEEVHDLEGLAEVGEHLFADPGGVGGDQHVGHGRRVGGRFAGYHPGAPPAGRRPPGGHVLDIQLDQAEGYTVCRPVGELDAFTVSQFRQALAELASNPRLLIDMSGVPFVDSAGLGALIGGIRRARELGGDVAVACNRPTLTRLLRTTGFDRIVTVAETVEDAAAALRSNETTTQEPAP